MRSKQGRVEKKGQGTVPVETNGGEESETRVWRGEDRGGTITGTATTVKCQRGSGII